MYLFLLTIIFSSWVSLAHAATFYVATNGNDTWSGTLADPNGSNTDGPWLTLGHAQTVMQGSSTKTVTIRAGTYSLVGASLTFTSADTGETWQAMIGETVILDGVNAGFIEVTGADTMTFRHLTFKRLGLGTAGNDGLYMHGSGHTVRSNTFLTCTRSCLSAAGLSGALIDSNTFDGQSPGNPPGDTSSSYSALLFGYNCHDNIVSHNLIKNAEGGGVAFVTGITDPPDSNNIVDRNILQDTNTNVVDNGGIYMLDRSHSAVGNQITNNVIVRHGGSAFLTNGTKAIYLDDDMSHVLVSGNTCCRCGTYALQYHGGDHNTVTNNIFDLTGGTILGLYQEYLAQGNFGMTNNTFDHNLVYVADTVPNPVWQWSGTTMAAPSDTTNLYYSATGGSWPNSGNIVDANPILANPQFADAPNCNYAMPGTSPAFTTVGFQPLPTDQGPVAESVPTIIRIIR